MITKQLTCDRCGTSIGNEQDFASMKQLNVGYGVDVLIQHTSSNEHLCNDCLGTEIENCVALGQFRTEKPATNMVSDRTHNGLEGLQHRTVRLTKVGDKLTSMGLRNILRRDDPQVFRKFKPQSIPSVFGQLGLKGVFRKTGKRHGSLIEWERVR